MNTDLLLFLTAALPAFVPVAANASEATRNYIPNNNVVRRAAIRIVPEHTTPDD